MTEQPIPIISVCVPTYKRASMLRDVVTSFWAQDFARSELVVLDDASPDETPALMEAVMQLDHRVVYSRNQSNVGLTENTLRALQLARGEFIVLLGDDDVLLGPDALTRYVDVFAQHPDVHYAYPNQIQMDGDMAFDLVYRHFDRDVRCDPGLASFGATWLKCVQTAGTALRRSEDLYKFYPQSAMILPQVELVGRLLLHHASFGMAHTLTGVRAHSDQLGWHANRRQRIVGPEKHGTLEILDIVTKLNLEFGQGPDPKHTAKLMAHALATNLPNEKLKGSTRIAVANAIRLMRTSPIARHDPLLLTSLVVTTALPPRALNWIRKSAKSAVRQRQSSDAAWFSTELCRQRDSTADRWQDVALQRPR
jgi:glycosyltransferase involved in cell wall biosynthesis